ncbi:flagellar export protein FliJ [Piscinibacter aquaticus]|uniref:Flagellar FliJ protein n=1 Tax=Piscinibacter aquaticus TaxID=392597 RepID=A0A5C6TXQ5_9BURK|nr:flagellar export protein FliJ [Piscinibacter aquaticus]
MPSANATRHSRTASACARRWTRRAPRPSSCSPTGATTSSAGPNALRRPAVQLLHSYHGFVTRLTQAIEHQDRVVVQAERQLERAAETLQQQELRVASVLKLIERRIAEIEKTSAQREQRALDELASRAAWNRLAAATTRF